MEKYEKLCDLEHGGFYYTTASYRKKSTGELVVIKKFRKNANEGIPQIPQRVLKEVGVLRKLREHPNVIRFIELIVENMEFNLVFEHAETHMKAYRNEHELTPEKLKVFLRQILQGVCHCHDGGAVHCDIKPENIFIGSDETVKLAGFALTERFTVASALSGEYYSQHCIMGGSPSYMAPELLFNSPEFSTAMDMWSVGCTFSEMVTNQLLVTGSTRYSGLNNIIKIIGPPDLGNWSMRQREAFYRVFPSWESDPVAQEMDLEQIHPNLDREGLDLLKRMLEWDPRLRISAKEALNHKFLL